jgi:hypothetical protein
VTSRYSINDGIVDGDEVICHYTGSYFKNIKLLNSWEQQLQIGMRFRMKSGRISSENDCC